MQYCCLPHQTLLPSPVTSTTGCCVCFGSISSFFLEFFLHSSSVAYSVQFSCSVVSHSLWLHELAAPQASLSITNSRSSLRLMSIKSVMPSSQLILCHPLLLLPPIPPSIRVYSDESTLRMRWPSTGVSALASFLPKKSQGWSPSEWTGNILGTYQPGEFIFQCHIFLPFHTVYVVLKARILNLLP